MLHTFLFRELFLLTKLASARLLSPYIVERNVTTKRKSMIVNSVQECAVECKYRLHEYGTCIYMYHQKSVTVMYALIIYYEIYSINSLLHFFLLKLCIKAVEIL